MEAKSIMPESHRQGRNLTESVITWAWTPEDRRPRSRPDRRQALPARRGRAANMSPGSTPDIPTLRLDARAQLGAGVGPGDMFAGLAQLGHRARALGREALCRRSLSARGTSNRPIARASGWETCSPASQLGHARESSGFVAQLGRARGEDTCSPASRLGHRARASGRRHVRRPPRPERAPLEPGDMFAGLAQLGHRARRAGRPGDMFAARGRRAGRHVRWPRAARAPTAIFAGLAVRLPREAGEHVSRLDARAISLLDARAISLLDVPALRGADRPDARARWPSCARSRRSDRRTCVRPAGPLHSKAPALAAPPMCVRKRHSWRVTPTNRPSRLLSEDTRSCGNATFADRTLRELKTVGLKPGPTETLLQEKEGTATCGSSTPIRQVRAGQGGASSTKKLSSRRGG